MEDRKPNGTLPGSMFYVPNWADGHAYPAGHADRPLYVTVSNPQGTVQVSSLPAVTIAGTVPVSGNFYPATQPVSGSVSVSNTVTVTGALTDAQLRASAVAVKSTPLDLFGTPLTPTITTTAQTVASLAASLFSGGATHVVVVAGGAVVPMIGSLSLTALALGGNVLNPRGERCISQAEAAVVSLKVAVTSTTVVIYGYR